MATSGTYNFNLDIDEVIQEASEMKKGKTFSASHKAAMKKVGR